jgi:hypothetical protein
MALQRCLYNTGMVLVKLCIYLGVALALLALRWLLFGPPDPDNRGSWTPWG